MSLRGGLSAAQRARRSYALRGGHQAPQFLADRLIDRAGYPGLRNCDPQAICELAADITWAQPRNCKFEVQSYEFR